MCETMQKIVDRERDDTDVKARMDIALNLWSEGEHDLDKISRTTKLPKYIKISCKLYC